MADVPATIDQETSEDVLAIWCCYLIMNYDSTLDPALAPFETRDFSTFYAAQESMREASTYAQQLADATYYRDTGIGTMKRVCVLIDSYPRVPSKLPDFAEGD